MRPLDGMVILDFSRAVQGPYCSMTLSDMGAEVIKIEEPTAGDVGRQAGVTRVNGETTYFLAVNRNKKSVTLNLKSEEAKEIIFRLAKRCDVVLENYRPGVMDRLGFGYETLAEINPRLVYCAASGFGQTGPYRGKKGLDLLGQGMGGLISITGEIDGPPMAAGASICDFNSGLQCAYGIVLALFARERTGKGQKVEVCLLDSQISALSLEATAYLNSGQVPQRHGSAWFETIPYQAFQTKDREICVGAGDWPQLCRVMGRKDLATDPRFDTNEARVMHRQEIISIMKEVFEQKTSAEWLAALEEADILCGPVNNMEDVFADPQVLHNQMVVEMDHPQAGRIRLPGIAVKLRGTPGQGQTPPPLLGQHTDEVLRGLGYSDDQIAGLRERKTI